MTDMSNRCLSSPLFLLFISSVSCYPDGSHELHRNAKEGMHVSAEDDHLGPKRYYDKSKSFFDNIPSDNGLR